MAAGTGWVRSGLEEPGDLPARCGEATMGYRIWQESQAQIESTRVGLDEYNNAPSLTFKEYYARDLVEVISIGRTIQQFSCSEQEYASIQKRACSSS